MIGGTNIVSGGGDADKLLLQKSIMEYQNNHVIDWIFSMDKDLIGGALSENQVVGLFVSATNYHLKKMRAFNHYIGAFLATCFALDHLVWDAYDSIESIRSDSNRILDIQNGSKELRITWELLDTGEFILYELGSFPASAAIGNPVVTEIVNASKTDVAYNADHVELMNDSSTFPSTPGKLVFAFTNPIILSSAATLEFDIAHSGADAAQYALIGYGDQNNDSGFDVSLKVDDEARSVKSISLSAAEGDKYIKVYHYSAENEVSTTKIYKISIKL